MTRLPRLAATALAVALLAAPSANAAEPRFITIGTGGVTGVYYPAGGAICQFVNKGRKQHGVRCSVESTGGSIGNLEGVRTGQLEFGLAQSDWQHHAYEGTARFADRGPHRGLRSVFSLYPEPFTVVARAGTGIRSFEGLAGKRVNIGNPGSGHRATMDLVLAAFGWTAANFAAVTELRSAEQAAALCADRVDAIVFTGGHPNGSIREATTACESVIVGVTGPVIDGLVAGKPFYRGATIPGGTYRGTPGDVETFGVTATLVTSSQVPDEVVRVVVGAVLENLEAFRKLHPAFASLEPTRMALEGLSAPLHPGAAAWFAKAGLR